MIATVLAPRSAREREPGRRADAAAGLPRGTLRRRATARWRGGMADELPGKVALITGAGQGIGRAFALGFARAGAAVLVSDVVDQNAERTAEAIQHGGGQALGLRLDVSKRAEVEAVVDAAVERFGRLDILINNA